MNDYMFSLMLEFVYLLFNYGLLLINGNDDDVFFWDRRICRYMMMMTI